MNILGILVMILMVFCGVLFLIAKAQIKRADKAEGKAASFYESYKEMEQRAESLQNILGKYKKLEVQANHERQNLASTADTALLHRANALFGGVQDDSEKRTGNR
ncbi:hypothetical protein Holit_01769 [Hollandina sp. SP2]